MKVLIGEAVTPPSVRSCGGCSRKPTWVPDFRECKMGFFFRQPEKSLQGKELSPLPPFSGRLYGNTVRWHSVHELEDFL
jgi:hypothetical protein